MAAKTAARAAKFKPVNDFGSGPMNFRPLRGGNSFGFTKTLEIVYADNPKFGDIEYNLNTVFGLLHKVKPGVVVLPELTEETRREFTKKAKSEAENAKISIRNARREGNSQLKEFLKEKEISKDEERQGEEEIQKLTDEFVNTVDEFFHLKEKDLLKF